MFDGRQRTPAVQASRAYSTLRGYVLEDAQFGAAMQAELPRRRAMGALGNNSIRIPNPTPSEKVYLDGYRKTIGLD